MSEALYKIKPTDTAAVKGQYATWVAPLSYLGMHAMQEALGWIDGANKCVRNGDLCDMTVCPYVFYPLGSVRLKSAVGLYPTPLV